MKTFLDNFWIKIKGVFTVVDKWISENMVAVFVTSAIVFFVTEMITMAFMISGILLFLLMVIHVLSILVTVFTLIKYLVSASDINDEVKIFNKPE
jgi:ABC-type multidrug transport system permease subunit